MDRSRSHDARFHRRDQVGGGEGFPLHQSDRAAASAQREVDAEIEAADAGAEGEGSDGSWIHKGGLRG
jgi:hypothetical protein